MYSTARSPHNYSEIRGAMVAQQKWETLISPMKTQMSCSLYGTPCTSLIRIYNGKYFLKQIFIQGVVRKEIPLEGTKRHEAWRNGGANHFTLIFESWHR